MGLLDVATTPPNAVSSPTLPSGYQTLSPGAWVASGESAVNNVINGYILKPKSAQGIGGFIFDYEGMTQLDADTEITDHYTEANQFFNDHAAQKPLILLLRGYIGEVVQNAPSGLLGLLSTIQGGLQQLPGLLGKYTPGAVAKVSSVVNSATNVVNQISTVANKAQNLYNLIAPSSAAPSKQSKAMNVLMAMRDSAVVFTLSTPWGLLSKTDQNNPNASVPRSFVIKHLTLIQDEFQTVISDIAVTVKEVNFAAVENNAAGATQAQATNTFIGRKVFDQAPANLGNTQGVAVPSPLGLSSFVPSAGATL